MVIATLMSNKPFLYEYLHFARNRPAFQPIKTYTHPSTLRPDFLLLANFYLVWKWFKGFEKKLREIDLNPLPINGVKYAVIKNEPFR